MTKQNLAQLRTIRQRIYDNMNRPGGGPEAHGAEDDLMHRALELIRDHSVDPHSRTLARIGLSTAKLEFDRWYE